MPKLFKLFTILFSFALICGLTLAQDNAQDLAPPSTGQVIIAGTGGTVPSAPGAVLYDQGQLINDPGGGSGGADRSFIESALGHTLFGWGHQVLNNNSMADDFTIPAGEIWTIDELITFAYQTNATTTSTITEVRAQIWDGDPMTTGTVIWGNLTTSIMTATTWSNIYRTTDTAPTNTARAIMQQTSTIGTVLPEGTYWMHWQSDGTLASGPWCPPVTILGVAVTGDALQNLAGTTWQAALNGTEPNGAPFILMGSVAGGGTITIAEAIEDLNGDFIPDRLGQTVTVEGVVFSPNFQTTNNSFYIDDGTAGTDIFMFGPPLFNWAMGDMLEITGEVDQFNGMTEIIPADSSGWVFVSSGNPTPDLIELTLAQYKADPEAYEGSLVGFISLTLVDGTWPAAGNSANLDFSDGIDTVTFRIDSDTDIPGQPEPTWPRDILGIGSQFDSSTPPDGGYQIFPRFYATDFLPAGTIPVELTSFTAQVSNRVVTLNWTTATELNNQMFEIDRRSEDGQYIRIGYVNGHGTTTEPQEYSYIDNTVEIGTFFYRLKQIDFGGRYAYSDVVQVDVVAPANFTLEQNYPNPFNPSTKITFNLAVDSKVSLKVFDVLGQEVTKLITTNMTAGVHEINFNASNINSGVYFYRLDATGVDGTNFTSVKKMILTK